MFTNGLRIPENGRLLATIDIWKNGHFKYLRIETHVLSIHWVMKNISFFNVM